MTFIPWWQHALLLSKRKHLCACLPCPNGWNRMDGSEGPASNELLLAARARKDAAAASSWRAATLKYRRGAPRHAATGKSSQAALPCIVPSTSRASKNKRRTAGDNSNGDGGMKNIIVSRIKTTIISWRRPVWTWRICAWRRRRATRERRHHNTISFSFAWRGAACAHHSSYPLLFTSIYISHAFWWG